MIEQLGSCRTATNIPANNRHRHTAAYEGSRVALTYATAGQKLFPTVKVRDNVEGRNLTFPELHALAGREK
jgi:hypothetical protein